MKIAVIGSRVIYPNDGDFEQYLCDADEVVSGGAKGVDMCVKNYAKKRGIKITEFLPKYERYGRAAPIIRNREIVDYADRVVAFWNAVPKVRDR